MTYVDKDYYDNVYLGATIVDADEFERLAKRASEVVDQLTHYRIKNLDDLVEPIRERVKQAVCAQIEFYVLNGGYEATMQQSDLQSVSIGSFSYAQSGSTSESLTNAPIGKNVLGYLSQTGLLYSGIGVRHGY